MFWFPLGWNSGSFWSENGRALFAMVNMDHLMFRLWKLRSPKEPLPTQQFTLEINICTHLLVLCDVVQLLLPCSPVDLISMFAPKRLVRSLRWWWHCFCSPTTPRRPACHGLHCQKVIMLNRLHVKLWAGLWMVGILRRPRQFDPSDGHDSVQSRSFWFDGSWPGST